MKAYVPTAIVVEPQSPPAEPIDLETSSPQAHNIVGSFNKEKIVELCELNKHLRCDAHSIAYYDPDTKQVLSINRGPGPVNYLRLNESSVLYCIIYQRFNIPGKNIQPVTSLERRIDTDDLHYVEHTLWHKGELSHSEVKRLQLEEKKPQERWDTYLFLLHLIRYGVPAGVEGRFSCVYSDSLDLYLLRNEFESMFIDEHMSISTTPFAGSHSTGANKMWKMDFDKKILRVVDVFETVKDWNLRH